MQQRFLTEAHALHELARTGVRVPGILDVDFQQCTLTTALILGDVVRERLARASAIVRDRDVAASPDFASVGPAESWRRRVAQGASVAKTVLGQEFIDQVYAELRGVHSAGFVWNDLKFGNIVIDHRDGRPWLLDFEISTDCTRMNRCSRLALADNDIARFNQHFNQHRRTSRRVARRRRKAGGSAFLLVLRTGLRSLRNTIRTNLGGSTSASDDCATSSKTRTNVSAGYRVAPRATKKGPRTGR